MKKLLRSSSVAYNIVIPLFTLLLIYSIHNVIYFWEDFRLESPVDVNSSVVASSVVSNTKQPPTSIYIPKINKRLPIQAAVVKDNSWQLFDSSVAWLSTSAVPDEGNVILYAHNWRSLWGDLYKVTPGDMVEVDQNGKLRTYKVIESKAVSKTDIDAVLSSDNKLTMYTCEGTFDQKRRVVYAVPL